MKIISKIIALLMFLNISVAYATLEDDHCVGLHPNNDTKDCSLCDTMSQSLGD